MIEIVMLGNLTAELEDGQAQGFDTTLRVAVENDVDWIIATFNKMAETIGSPYFIQVATGVEPTDISVRAHYLPEKDAWQFNFSTMWHRKTPEEIFRILLQKLDLL